jgi:TolB-like protein
MKKAAAIVFFLMVLFFPAAAQGKPTLAILPFTGGAGEDGETIAELFSFEETLNGAFSPVPRTSINRAIGREQNFQMGSGMTDPDTIIALGRQLGARYIVAGNITSLGGQKLLIISIMRIDNLQQIAGDIQTYTDIEEIQGKLPAMAQNIAAAARADTSRLPRLAVIPFQLRTSTNESDADVLAQILAINIVRSGKYAVFPRTATLDQVQDEYDTQHNGDTADDEAVSIGKGENPPFVLSGTARRLGSTRNMFNASIINLGTGVQVQGASVNYETLNDGMNAMRDLAIELAGASFTVNSAAAFEAARTAINAGRGDYTITVSGDFALNGINFNATNGPKTITIRGDASLRTISYNGDNNYLFYIPTGITLVMGNNIRLNGTQKGSLVYINSGGMLQMETGATFSAAEHGVKISGGTFTMNGGTISGNTASDGGGGGVHINSGIFTMSGGTISGNGNARGGGGVYIQDGTFTMSGGTISNNIALLGGGVIMHGGTFTMSGGTISGNTASGGGGVCVFIDSAIFIKTGGTIDGTNRADYGRVVNTRSGKRETAAGPGDNMDSRVSGRAGGWE